MGTITVFGATGFTGQRVVEELLQKAPHGTTINVAGRSALKLEALKAKLQGGERLTVTASVDVSDPVSLQRMAEATRPGVVMSAVGPYRFYGEPCFKACAEAGTDYLDLCGEPEFIERMELQYSSMARASGALMACAAGFDSIPADMGCIFTQRLFRPPAVPSSVEAVIAISAPAGYSAHFATWEAAVHGISSVASLHKIRKEARALAAGQPPLGLKPLGPRPKAANGPVWDPRVEAFSLPFPGADASVVRRTQLALAAAGQPPVHFAARFAVKTRLWTYAAVAIGASMFALCKYGWGRALLLRYPGVFSFGMVTHAGPSQHQMEQCTTTVTLFGAGYSAAPPPGSVAPQPDKHVVARVALGDPGYLATSQIFVQAALTLLQERGSIAAQLGGGGVFTVGAMFRDTRLIQRLSDNGVAFEVVAQ